MKLIQVELANEMVQAVQAVHGKNYISGTAPTVLNCNCFTTNVAAEYIQFLFIIAAAFAAGSFSLV